MGKVLPLPRKSWAKSWKSGRCGAAPAFCAGAQLLGLGLGWCWRGGGGGDVTPAGAWTSFSARTALQPQLHKAVGPDGLGHVLHRLLKDWILFCDAQARAPVFVCLCVRACGVCMCCVCVCVVWVREIDRETETEREWRWMDPIMNELRGRENSER